MKTMLFLLFILLLPPASGWAAPQRIVALGDSLTAGYGLQPGEDYPSRLENALRAEGLDVQVDNAGVSGDTSAGGAARLNWAIGDNKPDLVIVALGANDMLRALPPTQMEKNLRHILQTLKERKIPALVYGMRAGLNLPADYRKQFDDVYARLAEEFKVPLYPFFLEGVALDRSLNLDDGVHPNPQGIAVLVERTLPLVSKALKH